MVRGTFEEGGWFTPDERGTDTRGSAEVLTEDRSTHSGVTTHNTRLEEIEPVRGRA